MTLPAGANVPRRNECVTMSPPRIAYNAAQFDRVRCSTTKKIGRFCRMASCNIGLIGLAVMGENLVLNMESRGFSVAVFNRTTAKVDEFVGGKAGGKKISGFHSLEGLVTRDRKSTRLNSSHIQKSRMPSSA